MFLTNELFQLQKCYLNHNGVRTTKAVLDALGTITVFWRSLGMLMIR